MGAVGIMERKKAVNFVATSIIVAMICMTPMYSSL